MPFYFVCERSNRQPFSAIEYVGIAVWIIGFIIITIADCQLTWFKQARDLGQTNGQKLLKTGLWAWSRHPNYFGELTMHLGMYLFAFNIPGAPYTWFGPALLAIFLIFISGIPTIENHRKDDEEFKLYAKRTSALLLWPPKQLSAEEMRLLSAKDIELV